MKQLDEYFKLQKEIYDYFGYVEDWVVIPLDDARQYYWRIYNDTVCFAESIHELETEDGQYFENEIYKQRFLPKWIYEGEKHTMICVDTRTDGNKFLQVFDSNKRVKCLKY